MHEACVVVANPAADEGHAIGAAEDHATERGMR